VEGRSVLGSRQDPRTVREIKGGRRPPPHVRSVPREHGRNVRVHEEREGDGLSEVEAGIGRGDRALLAKALLRKGARVVGYDPLAGEAFHREVPKVEIARDLTSALAHADVCIVHNDWPQWRELRAADFAGMKRMVVIDGRRILRQEAMAGAELLVLGG